MRKLGMLQAGEERGGKNGFFLGWEEETRNAVRSSSRIWTLCHLPHRPGRAVALVTETLNRSRSKEIFVKLASPRGKATAFRTEDGTGLGAPRTLP